MRNAAYFHQRRAEIKKEGERDREKRKRERGEGEGVRNIRDRNQEQG